MESEKMLEVVLNNKIKLPTDQVISLKNNVKEILYEYNNRITSIHILSSQNRKFLDDAVEWCIKRLEYDLNVYISDVSNIPVFKIDINNAPVIASANVYYEYLNPLHDNRIFKYLNEYVTRVMSNSIGYDNQIQTAINNSAKLNFEEKEKLKKMLIDYCEIYYGNLPLFVNRNDSYLNQALEWTIRRIEGAEILNARINENNRLVILDGSYLATANNYYNYLVQNQKDISYYLNEFYYNILGANVVPENVNNFKRN